MADELWSCPYCGDSGVLPEGVTIDEFQCPSCGELVIEG